ncbi:hypothetical protein PUG42_05925 [Erwiniaceae bacterium L1_54_3]|nr:hypothetical protein [Erwiniaceae bacterium L1_54_3]
MKTVEVTISGLEEWKDGIVYGAEISLTVLCAGEVIISDTLNGKSSAPYTRKYDVGEVDGDLTWHHNRPDLTSFSMSAKFSE